MRNRNRSHRSTSISDFLDDNWEMMVGVAIMIFVAVAVFSAKNCGDRLQYERAADPETLCRLNVPAPEATLVLVDATDPLAKENAPRFRALIESLRDQLPRYGRLIIVPFDGDLGKPLVPVFDVCSPGQRAQADSRTEGLALIETAYDKRFEEPLQREIDRLSSVTRSPTSPIVEQIERVMHDPALHWSGAHRSLILLSDGLQNSAQASVYHNPQRFQLPSPEHRFLSHIDVRFIELVNARDSRLQTSNIREQWDRWFARAGAIINDHDIAAASPKDKSDGHPT